MSDTTPAATKAPREVLGVTDLHQHFSGHHHWLNRLLHHTADDTVRAVDGVTLSLAQGETLGLVGESGCGKSTLSRSIMGLYTPTSGQIRYDGQPLDPLPTRAQRRQVQMIFQDPYSSLNPRMTVGQMLGEILRFHQIVPRAKVAERSRELMDLVGLPVEALGRRPSQFSGGQRQRVGIARALALEPRVLIADEAVSALDVSVQATVINLLLDLKQALELSMIFVSHNMAVVRQVSDRVAVMYRGKIVETGPTAEIFEAPAHPYTRLLLRSVPRMSSETEAVPPAAAADPDLATGTSAAVAAGPAACRFIARCPVSDERCVEEPELLRVARTAGQSAACWQVATANQDPTTTQVSITKGEGS